MATKTKLQVEGDVVVHRESAEYCYESSVITNPDASNAISIADPVGYPVKKSGANWVPIVATDEANATGIIVEGEAISALAASGATTTKYKILVNGPAMVISNNFAANDYNSVAFTNATLVTAVEGLSPKIKTKVLPTKTETGTT